jgi:hypothetical protein
MFVPDSDAASDLPSSSDPLSFGFLSRQSRR